jgi:hypothetical protein
MFNIDSNQSATHVTYYKKIKTKNRSFFKN